MCVDCVKVHVVHTWSSGSRGANFFVRGLKRHGLLVLALLPLPVPLLLLLEDVAVAAGWCDMLGCFAGTRGTTGAFGLDSLLTISVSWLPVMMRSYVTGERGRGRGRGGKVHLIILPTARRGGKQEGASKHGPIAPHLVPSLHCTPWGWGSASMRTGSPPSCPLSSCRLVRSGCTRSC